MTAAGSAPAWVAVVRSPRSISPLLGCACLLLLLITVAVIAPGLLVHSDPDAVDTLNALSPPSGAHPFGTDENGRDLLTRVVYGARPSVLVGLGATAASVALGSLFALVATAGGRVGDAVIMRLMDVLLAVPEMLLALLVITIAGPGMVNAAIAIAVFGVPVYMRVVRSSIIAVRNSDYVTAAVCLGLRPGWITLRHVVPNAIAPVSVVATLNVAGAIGAGAALSFLGLGPKPPSSQWGSMLAASQSYFAVGWWTAVAPGLAIVFTVLPLTVVGYHLRRRTR